MTKYSNFFGTDIDNVKKLMYNSDTNQIARILGVTHFFDDNHGKSWSIATYHAK